MNLVGVANTLPMPYTAAFPLVFEELIPIGLGITVFGTTAHPKTPIFLKAFDAVVDVPDHRQSIFLPQVLSPSYLWGHLDVSMTHQAHFPGGAEVALGSLKMEQACEDDLPKHVYVSKADHPKCR